MAGKRKAGETEGQEAASGKGAKARKARTVKADPAAAGAKRKVGRPSGNPVWHPEWREEFLRRIESGRSARDVSDDADMPDRKVIWEKLDTEEDFAQRYARACEARADAIFEECFDIADDGSNDWMGENDPDNPGYAFNGEHVQRSKLRIETRKWAVAKLAPKKYGEKLAVDATVQVSEMPEEERLAKLVAQIPVLNSMLGKVGWVIVKLE